MLEHEGFICELIDGVLVEKAMGHDEAQLTFELGYYLAEFLRRHNLGFAAGPDGIMKLASGLLRIPDIAFTSWDRLPDRRRPHEPVPALTLDLAIEVISKGNTKKEMRRKLREYFDSGTRIVWFIYPKTRDAYIYTSPTEFRHLTEDQSLDGGNVLPGFTLSLRELFEQANRGPDA